MIRVRQKQSVPSVQPHDWTKEWVDMPEFVQNKQRPYKELKIRFATKADYDSFSRLIGQKLTEKTKFLWHPVMVRGVECRHRYVR